LYYEWLFPDSAEANIVATENNNEKIRVQFDAVGKHIVKLTVRDSYGKTASLEKEIEVKSTLRPEIFVVPVAIPRGNPMNFVVKSNQSIVNYQWDFGDNDTRTIQSDRIAHTYTKANVYKVTLTVNGAE
jgi:PKD repeat protein